MKMTSILQNKLAKKIVLLAALTASFAYLRKPGDVHAQSCFEECSLQLTKCEQACEGQSGCDAGCIAAEVACLKNCH
jgi:hypothetical protein